VSTPALEALGRSFGFSVVRTLPGFKWIARVPQLIFGFEEALGYLVNPETLNDKDGISAGLAVLALVNDLHAAGLTLLDKVTELTTAHGNFVSTQLSMRTDPQHITETMSALRRSAPAAVGGLSILRVDDYARGVNRLPAANLLAWHLADGSRVMLRPSGTEAKLKVYVDSTSPESLDRIDADIRALFSAG
jgi:phosphomannomutase